METMRRKLVKIYFLTGERIILIGHEKIRKGQVNKE